MRSCEEIQDRLSLLLDGDLPAEDAATLRAHLRGCAACRGVFTDLEHVRSAARDLGPVAPPAHLWLEVAGQLRRDAAQPSPRRLARPLASTGIGQWAALAAALLLVTLGLYVVRSRGPVPSTTTMPATPASAAAASTAPAAAGNAPVAGSVETVAQELNLAMEHYQKAIGELEAAAQNGRGAIDPTLANTVQRNLTAIDAAIAQSRSALTDDPSNEPARESLFEALRRKVSVLQATVTLINQMRLGDADGAARSIAGAGKKS